MTLYTRLLLVRDAITHFVRSWTARITGSLAETNRPGLSGGTIRDHKAEDSLRRLAESPAVFAATMRRTIGLQRFPIVVYEAEPGGRTVRPIDPTRAPWAAACLRLLQRPDASDAARPFPRMPGEYLLALLMADYLLTGNAYLRVQRAASNTIIGLQRLHPASVILVTSEGQELIRYRPPGAPEQTFPAFDVVHIRALPWRKDIGENLGTGAGEALAPLVAAELAAMRRTAMAIEQGGVDVQVVAETPEAALYLMNPEARAEVQAETTEALRKQDSRVLVPSGGLALKPLGLTPAEIKAPELLNAARSAELLALGVVPVAVGDPSGATYATAAAQLRIQYGLDLEFTEVFSFWFLRPLAQAFAARDPAWLPRVSQVTCAYDLAGHEGALAARTEAINRMQQLVNLGWTAEQAAAIEAMDLPRPEGTPANAGLWAAPPANTTPAQTGGVPRAPLGDPPSRATGTARPFWRRRNEGADSDVAIEERALAWRAIEDGRADSDSSLQAAADRALAEDKARLMGDLEALLRGAWDGTRYAPINWDTLAADPEIYNQHLTPVWRETWDSATQEALPEGLGEAPRWEDGDGEARLSASCAAMAQTSRDQVANVGQALVDEGRPPSQVLDEATTANTWSPQRSDQIARTETVRAQSHGTRARFRAAEASGVTLQREWLSARDANVRSHHRALDGKRTTVEGRWTFPSGVETEGPGLSGRAEEDCNCRCAERAVLL